VADRWKSRRLAFRAERSFRTQPVAAPRPLAWRVLPVRWPPSRTGSRPGGATAGTWKTPPSDQGVRREPNCELAPQQSLLCRLALLHIVDFLGGLVLQLNRFVQGLVTQIARIVLDLVEGRFFGGLELRRLHKGLLAERDENDPLTVLVDIECQRTKGNTNAFLAYAQDPANTDDDSADLAFAVENEIIDIPNGLTSRVVNGLHVNPSGEPLIGWLLGDKRHGRTGRAGRLG